MIQLIKQRIAGAEISDEQLLAQKAVLEDETYKLYFVSEKDEDPHESAMINRASMSTWILHKEATTDELRELFKLDDSDFQDPTNPKIDLEWLFTPDDDE